MKQAYLFIFFTAAAVASFTVIDNVFFLDAGYTLAFIGLMVAVFNVSVTVSELPFAIFFDRFSNKRAIQIGNLIRLAALSLFFLNLGHVELLVAQVLAGVAVAASSGTSQALVVNAIQSSNAKDIARAFGNITYVSAAGGMLGGVLGGFLYGWNPSSIWLVSMAFMMGAAISIFFFKDVRAEGARIPLGDYLRGLSGVVRRQTFWILVVSNGAAVAPVLLWQVKFNATSLTFTIVGFLLMNLGSLLAPLVARLARIEPRHVAAVAAVNLLAASLFALAPPGWMTMTTFPVHVIMQNLLVIMASALYHAEVPNGLRGAAGSVVSLFDSLVVAVVAPIVALVATHFGIAWGTFISSVLYLIIAGWTSLPAFRRRIISTTQALT